MPNLQSAALRKELEAIASRPNGATVIRSGVKSYRLLYWWVTAKGKRAGDWNLLQVLADKARDLNCDTFLMSYNGHHRRTYKFLRCYPCRPELANCVCVWIPY